MYSTIEKSDADSCFRRGVFFRLIAVVVCVQSVAHADMTIRAANAKRHDRFYAGDDKAFIGQDFNWSGVGKTSDNYWVTMVSPTYFLSANHYHANSGSTVTFYEGNSQSNGREYTIDGGHQIFADGKTPTDLWLGRLHTPLNPSDKIGYYPILLRDSEASYVGMELYNYGKPDRVGTNMIDSLVSETHGGSTGNSMLYDYGVGADETFLEIGDSGGPSFTIWNGELALLGIHWFNSQSNEPWHSGDTFVPSYLDDINAGMTGESLTTVPEPATIAIWLTGLIGLGLLRRRWK